MSIPPMPPPTETIQLVAAVCTGGAAGAWASRGAGWRDRLMIFGTGASCAFFGAPPLASYYNLADATLAIGWMMAALGALIVRKTFELADALPAGSIAAAILDRVRGKGGA